MRAGQARGGKAGRQHSRWQSRHKTGVAGTQVYLPDDVVGLGGNERQLQCRKGAGGQRLVLAVLASAVGLVGPGCT